MSTRSGLDPFLKLHVKHQRKRSGKSVLAAQLVFASGLRASQEF